MHAEAVHVRVDAYLTAVTPNDFLVDRGRVQRFVQRPGGVVPHWAKQGTSQVLTVPGDFQIFLDEPCRFRGDRHEADLVALTLDAKMEDTFPLLEVPDPELAEFFPA